MSTLKLRAMFVAAVAMGCIETDKTPSDVTGNSKLGIAEFVVDETADRTTIRGLDRSGSVVADLSLVHGTFAPTEYDTPEIVGRKLDISVRGQRSVWKTAGFSPTLHMPAPPSSSWAIAELVEDPHVKPVLARWLIGYEPRATLAGESAYYQSDYRVGWSGQGCSGNSCGEVWRNGAWRNINLCADHGGGLAGRVANNFGYGVEYVVPQCCGPHPNNSEDTQGVVDDNQKWFGYKACPPTADPNQDTSCGQLAGLAACKGCPDYVAAINYAPGVQDCEVLFQENGDSDVVSWAFYEPGDVVCIGNGHNCSSNGACCSGVCEYGTCVASGCAMNECGGGSYGFSALGCASCTDWYYYCLWNPGASYCNCAGAECGF